MAIETMQMPVDFPSLGERLCQCPRGSLDAFCDVHSRKNRAFKPAFWRDLVVAFAGAMLGETTFNRESNSKGKKAAAIAPVSALDNGNNAVASTFWLDGGKVPALSNEPLEFASNFSASTEAKFTAAAVAATLIILSNVIFISNLR